MKRISIDISEILLGQTDEVVQKDGFQSRSELIRFLIMTYVKNKSGSSANEKSTTKEEEENSEASQLDNVDLEYGVPPELIEKYERMAKAKN